MIDKLFVIEGDSNNPHRNLALEAVLLKRLQPGSVTCTCGRISTQ